MSKVFVGIDVSKKDLSITMIVNDKSHYCNITNDTKGFKEFSKWLKLIVELLPNMPVNMS